MRSRDPAVLDKLPLIVDVGSTYDPSNGRYDHHQKGFAETFDEKHKTKLSSAGLVYKHYGKDVIARLLTGATPEQIDVRCLCVFLQTANFFFVSFVSIFYFFCFLFLFLFGLVWFGFVWFGLV